MTGEIRTVELSEEELARVDALAAVRQLTREAMLEELTRVGLARWEGEGAPGAPSRASASPWLGWALLGFVVLAVGMGGWALVRSLE